jgi:hypothetical protein
MKTGWERDNKEVKRPGGGLWKAEAGAREGSISCHW